MQSNSLIWADNNHHVYFLSFGITSHLQTLVGCNNRGLIIDRRDTDVNGAGQTVFPDFCLIGHNGKVVSLCVTAIMDVGDVLTFHLETEVRWRRFMQRLTLTTSKTTVSTLSRRCEYSPFHLRKNKTDIVCDFQTVFVVTPLRPTSLMLKMLEHSNKTDENVSIHRAGYRFSKAH